MNSLVVWYRRQLNELESRKSSKNNQDHVMKVFTRLMLRGDLRAATRWMTERSSSSVLSPSEVIDCETNMTVLVISNAGHWKAFS